MMFRSSVNFRVVLMIGVLLLGTVALNHAQIGRGDYVIPPSWSNDGSRVAVVIGHEVEVNDASTGQLLYVLTGHTDFIPMIAWSPDNRLIATPSFDQTVKVWSAVDGALLHTLSGHPEAVVQAIWMPDSIHLLSFGFDTPPNLFVWDAQTGRQISAHNGGTASDIAFSPDGRKLVVSTPLSVHILNTVDFTVIVNTPRVICCTNTMYTIAWSPDNNQLVTGSTNGLVTLWDANTGAMISQWVANPYHQTDSRDIDQLSLSWVRDVVFASDGETVRAISGDGTLREWEVATGTIVQETQIGALYGVAWSPYAERLAILRSPNATAQIEGKFDANSASAELMIMVPTPSLERLNRLRETCVTTPNPIMTATDANLREFTTQIEALSDDQIPPGCRADLLAIAEALKADE
ncbi:MAG: hypothetical protein MUF87_14930 [Anaerolineae bacterium]|jgi:WD40 repeat protein|nr:hypothetical protein [Anaerolineae bacterium]